MAATEMERLMGLFILTVLVQLATLVAFAFVCREDQVCVIIASTTNAISLVLAIGVLGVLVYKIAMKED